MEWKTLIYLGHWKRSKNKHGGQDRYSIIVWFHTNTLEHDEIEQSSDQAWPSIDSSWTCDILFCFRLLSKPEFRHGRKHGMWRKPISGLPWFGRELSGMQPWNLEVKISGQSLRGQQNTPKLPWYFRWRNLQNETSKKMKDFCDRISIQGMLFVDMIYIYIYWCILLEMQRWYFQHLISPEVAFVEFAPIFCAPHGLNSCLRLSIVSLLNLLRDKEDKYRIK